MNFPNWVLCLPAPADQRFSDRPGPASARRGSHDGPFVYGETCDHTLDSTGKFDDASTGARRTLRASDYGGIAKRGLWSSRSGPGSGRKIICRGDILPHPGTWHGRSLRSAIFKSFLTARENISCERCLSLNTSAYQSPKNAPTELMLVDPLGKRTGVDPTAGTNYREIPRSSYLSEEAAEKTMVLDIKQPRERKISR